MKPQIAVVPTRPLKSLYNRFDVGMRLTWSLAAIRPKIENDRVAVPVDQTAGTVNLMTGAARTLVTNRGR